MKNKFNFIPLICQQIFYAACLPIMKFFLRLRVEGRENLNGLSRGFIIASNHSAEIDSAFVRAALPFFSRFAPLYYVSNTKDRFHGYGWRTILYGGGLFAILGGYPVYKGHHDYAYSLQNHTALLKAKRTVSIFPEGKLMRGGTLGEARGGVAFLAKETVSPVVPVGISGLYGITRKDFFLRRRRVVVAIGVPLSPQAIVPVAAPSIDDYKRGAARVLEAISGLLGNHSPNVLKKSRLEAKSEALRGV